MLKNGFFFRIFLIYYSQVLFRTIGDEFRCPKLKLVRVIFTSVDCFIYLYFFILFWAMIAECLQIYEYVSATDVPSL